MTVKENRPSQAVRAFSLEFKFESGLEVFREEKSIIQLRQRRNMWVHCTTNGGSIKEIAP